MATQSISKIIQLSKSTTHDICASITFASQVKRSLCERREHFDEIRQKPELNKVVISHQCVEVALQRKPYKVSGHLIFILDCAANGHSIGVIRIE